ncbi:MAG: Ig-like domain-containing protein [Anaerolineae bacterium]|nr:Ig-like domain-containing protein [Anaerolineae bacterium]MDW8071667.1 Ig-like domain-containing protein [Anaerolineae bacterium]
MMGSSSVIKGVMGIGVVGIAAVALAACLPSRVAEQSTSNGPTVVVSSPRPGQVVKINQPIQVTSTSTDPDGVQKVELWADGALSRVDINPDVNSPYIVAQTWQSDKVGSHVFVVKAFDAHGNVGQSEPVVIAVEAGSPTATSLPVAQVSPSATVTPPLPATPVSPTVPSSIATTLPSATPPPPSATPQPPTPSPGCTPPSCRPGEVYYCPQSCPGGCGLQCATPSPTPTRPTFTPTNIEVHALLKPIWEKPEVKTALGYPSSTASDDRQYARQYFERGYMYWWNRPEGRGLIWVVQIPDGSAMSGFGWIGPFEDTWEGKERFSCEEARRNKYGPHSGFGKLWCDHPEIAQTIGVPREPERGTGESRDYGIVQFFQGGTMLYSPLDREVWVLVNGGTWQRYYR